MERAGTVVPPAKPYPDKNCNMSHRHRSRRPSCSQDNCGSRRFHVGDDGFTYCDQGHQQDAGLVVSRDTGELIIAGRTTKRTGDSDGESSVTRSECTILVFPDFRASTGMLGSQGHSELRRCKKKSNLPLPLVTTGLIDLDETSLWYRGV